MDATPPADPPPEPNPYEPPRAPTGPPPLAPYAMPSALMTVVGVASVAASSLIAFVATCFPLGVAAFGMADARGATTGLLLALAWLVGLASAVGTGVLVFRLMSRLRRRPLAPPPGEAPGPRVPRPSRTDA